MSKKTIVIGSDYSGAELLNHLLPIIQSWDLEVINLNQNKTGKTPYFQTAVEMAPYITDGQADFGILICGTGMGMSIAANKFSGIRAAVCESEDTAQRSRKINNANILCLGAKILAPDLAERMIRTFLNTDFLEDFDPEFAAWIRQGVAALTDVEVQARQ